MFLLIILLSLPSFASYSLDHTGCLYGDKILDSSKAGEKYWRKVPKDFTGLMVCLQKDGKDKNKVEFKNGIEEGTSEVYDSKGKLVEVYKSKQGKRHGLFKRYHNRTYLLVQEMEYENGKLMGLMKNYNSKTGKLEAIKRITKKRGDGTIIQYNKFGKIKDIFCGPISAIPEDETYCGRNGSGKILEIYFYGSDKVRETRRYKNLKIDGEVLEYDREGKIKRKSVYDRGERIETVSFDESKKSFKEVISGNVMTRISYFSEEKIDRKEVFTKNKLTSFDHYYQNGKIKAKLQTIKGVKNIETFYDDGSLQCKYSYKGGELTSSFYYFPFSRRSFEGSYVCKARDRKKLFKLNYKNGRLNGEQIYFNGDGKKRTTQLYVKGVLKSSKEYDEKGSVIDKKEFEEDGSVKIKKLPPVPGSFREV